MVDVKTIRGRLSTPGGCAMLLLLLLLSLYNTVTIAVDSRDTTVPQNNQREVVNPWRLCHVVIVIVIIII